MGAAPGLSPTMAVALLIPFTFKMSPEQGLIMLGAVYTSTVAGGDISAILLKIPGAPANIATVMDGYPMAKVGKSMEKRRLSQSILYNISRIKKLIIKGRENISPREIDNILYQHPAVLEAAAFATKCEHYGEKIEAGIVLKKNQNVTENDLIKHCENLIGKFKSPDKVYFLSELPKGPSGKIQRFKIQEKIKK